MSHTDIAICSRTCTLSCALHLLILRVQTLIKPRPHSRKEAKLDTKTKLYQLNELAGKQSLLCFGELCIFHFRFRCYMPMYSFLIRTLRLF